MSEHVAHEPAPSAPNVTAAAANTPRAPHDDDGAESESVVDLDDWALVDDMAEIVGSESQRTTQEGALVAAAVATGATVTEPSDELESAVPAAAPAPVAPSDASTEQEHASTVAQALAAAAPTELLDINEDASTLPAKATAVGDISNSSNVSGGSCDVPAGYMRVRVRVGETVRLAYCKPTQLVADFIAHFFADAVADGKRVRLIYMGMMLLQDRVMGEYGVEDNSVIHCVITDAPVGPSLQPPSSPVLKGLANPANSLLAITGVGLYGFWTLLYHFPHVFTWKSIALLSVFSAAHVSATIARFSSTA